MSNRIPTITLHFAVCCALLAGMSCRPSGRARTTERERVSKELDAKLEAWNRKIKGMTVSQLADQLVSESRDDTEPFNSTASKELISRGDQAAAELRPLLTKSDRSSFLGLMALRSLGREYQLVDPAFKVSVLTDALRTSRTFNCWGIPHMYWEDSAKALIEMGPTAVKSLEALLSDTRPAPLWGSEEVMEYERYKYRVCDYAWALLNEIKQQKVPIPTDPVERDKLISSLLTQKRGDKVGINEK